MQYRMSHGSRAPRPAPTIKTPPIPAAPRPAPRSGVNSRVEVGYFESSLDLRRGLDVQPCSLGALTPELIGELLRSRRAAMDRPLH